MMIKKIDWRDLWARRKQIIEGYYNTYLNFEQRQQIRQISEKRLAICRSNKCGLYDGDGSSPTAYVEGAESCGGCGCVLKEKTSCFSCECYLAEINKTPLWSAIKN